MLLYCVPISISAAPCRGTYDRQHSVGCDSATVRQCAPYVYTIYIAKSVQLTDELTILTNSQLAIYQRVTSFFAVYKYTYNV